MGRQRFVGIAGRLGVLSSPRLLVQESNEWEWPGVHNLRAADAADVQMARDRLRVGPEELVGSARDAMWVDTILARVPEVVRYARKAGRTIPVAVLHPLGRPTD